MLRAFTDAVHFPKKAVRTADGFLSCEAVATKPGVFTYMQQDGSILRVLRHPDEVFKADSMETLRMKPVTLEHPQGKRVTPENARQLQVGSTGEQVTNVDSKAVSVTLVVTDADAIRALENGVRNVSCGYQCELVEDSGVFEGQQYDHRQEEIRYNHLAITRSPRLGKDMAVLMDATDSLLQVDSSEIDEIKTHLSQRSKSMKYVIDGIEYDAAPEVINFLKKFEQKVTDSAKEIETLQGQVTTLKTEKDALQGKHDALKTENDSLKSRDIKAEAKAIAKARNELERKAGTVLEDGYKFDDKTDEQIKRDVVAKAMPKVDLKDKSESYVDAIFDAAIASHEEGTFRAADAANRRSSSVPHDPTQTDSDDPVEAAKNKMRDNQMNAWKGKTETK